MNTDTLIKEVAKAKRQWIEINNRITIDDLLAETYEARLRADMKVARAEKALARYERLKRSLDVRQHMASIRSSAAYERA